MTRTLRLAGAQMGPNQKADSREAILARMIALLEQAAAAGAKMVVFPELPLTTFFPRWLFTDQAELDSYFEREMPNPRVQPLFDRARALVALNRPADAEAALTTARKLSPENGTAWLLSATLARRMNKLPDALSYIQTTAALLPRDAAVALEAGNIAIAAGDEAAARKQWQQSIAIAPNSRQAATAKAQLAALATSAPPPTEPQSR